MPREDASPIKLTLVNEHAIGEGRLMSRHRVKSELVRICPNWSESDFESMALVVICNTTTLKNL